MYGEYVIGIDCELDVEVLVGGVGCVECDWCGWC